MQRPIEKYGWKYKRTDSDRVVYENRARALYLYFYLNSNKIEFLGVIHVTKFDDFEELQAIYETAKQIKEENKNE